MITIKSKPEVELMRQAGDLVYRTLNLVCDAAKAGMTTRELDAMAESFIRSNGGEPAFKGYMDYPATLCVSVDDEVVHGIPGDRRLLDGQIVSIDVGVQLQGWFADSARTICIGAVSGEAERLLKATSDALEAGIQQARAGNRLGDISAAVQTFVEKCGYSVVRDLVGHGIGRRMHEEPQVPNFGKPHTGVELAAGMVLAIEPMVNIGGETIKFDADKWTVRTADGSLSAHFEHTVAITDNGPDVLTTAMTKG